MLAADGKNQGGLQVAIVAAKDNAGTPVIDRQSEFSVKFTNVSKTPIQLWSEDCQLGYETLSFLTVDQQGQLSRMCKRQVLAWNWKDKPPQTNIILPGASYSWKVSPLAFFWGERAWKGVPEPTDNQTITLTAVFESAPSAAAAKYGVWIGRAASRPIGVQIIDPKLTTPHRCLEEDCPKLAIKMMEADPQWIERTDDYQRTPLHVAARYGHADVVRWLLSKGAVVNSRAYNQFTPLHLATEPEIVKLLIDHKADVNAGSAAGTVLQQAASDYANLGRYPEWAADRKKKRAVIDMLLDAGATYDICSACYLGDIERVHILLRNKKEVRDKDAMRAAVVYGQAAIVKLFLDHGADPEDADCGGLTFSYLAIEQPSVLKLLLDAGADPKVKVEYRGNGQGPEGSTLLHEAAEKGAIDSAKLLLAHGVNVNVEDRQKHTPLVRACMMGNAAMAEFLIQKGANVAGGGRLAMSFAAMQVRPEQAERNARYLAVIRVLQKAGVDLDLFAAIACNDVRRATEIIAADPNAATSRDLNGSPALRRAVTLDRGEIARLLLNKGCDPDIRSLDETSGYKNETPLLEAAFWGRLDIGKLLIERGADVNAKADRGVVPLHEAARMGHLDFVRLLLRHGANVNAKDDDGKDAIDSANLYAPSPEIVALLRSHGERRADAKK